MKKKLQIVGIALSVVLVSAALAVGILAFIRGKNVEETGNILGVTWYTPEEKEFTITTVDELYEFSSLSEFYKFEGQTIKLGADIIVNEGNAEDWITDAPDRRWKPIDKFAGTFDGQGHTISGVYGKTLQSPLALFTNSNKNAKFMDFCLVNSYFYNVGSKGTASISANGDGTFTKIYSDAIIDCQGENSGGISSHVIAQAKFEECWFDGTIVQTGRYLGGLVGNIINGRVTINHSLFSGKLKSLHDNADRDGNMVGGFVGSNAKTANVLVTDSLATGTIEAGYSTHVSTMIGVNYSGGTVVMTDTYDNVTSMYQTMIGGSSTAQAMKIGTEELLGVKAYQWTTLDFDKYWATVENDTPTLKHFTDSPLDLTGVEKAYDTSWFTPGTFNFTLTNLKQLYGFYMLSNSETFETMIIKLGADIVVNEGNAEDWMKDPSKAPANPWYAIGSRAVPFKGAFDGQGHTISGIYMDTNQNYNGFFGYVEKGTSIRNFKLTNSYYNFTNSDELYGIGGIAGETRGIIDSVYTDVIIETNGYQAGGIAGRMVYLDPTYITKCHMNNTWFDGKIYLRDNGRFTGGLVGYIGTGTNINVTKCTMDFTNCLSTGYLSADRASSASVFDKSVSKGGQSIGGLIGSNNGGIVVNIKDCLYAGLLDLQYGTYTGTIVGRLNNKGAYNITNTYSIADGYLLKGKLSDKVYEIHSGATLNGGATMMPSSFLTGYNGYKFTELNFDKYWAVVTDDTPILKSFATKVPSIAGVERLVDTSWYQANVKEYTIQNLKQFYGFWLLSSAEDFAGKTVKLGSDIHVNNTDAKTVQAWMDGTKKPTNIFLPIGSSTTPFAGTFDGQGHTISGVYMDANQNRVGLFGMTAPGSTLKNFKLVNSFFNFNDSDNLYGQAAIAGEVRGIVDTVYTNAVVLTTGYQVGGITGRAVYTDKTYESKFSMNNVWFDGQLILKDNARYAGSLAGYLGTGSGIEKEKAPLNFTNCLMTGYISSDRKSSANKFNPEENLGGQLVGGMLGQNNGSVIVNLSNSLNSGMMELQYGTYAGAIIGRMGSKGVYNLENVYTIPNSMFVKGKPNASLYEIHSNAIVSGTALVIPDSMLSGLNGVKYTSLDFENYWAAIENDSPILKSFASGSLDTSSTTSLINEKWYDEKATTLVINSIEDLYAFWQVSSYETFAGKTVELGKTIKVNGDWIPSVDAKGNLTNIPENLWLPIGSNTNRFAGTFDGKGKEIHGIYMDVNQNYVGLFGATATGSVIKNLSLTNSYIDAMDAYECYGIGTIVGEMRGTMDTVKSDAIINTIGKQVGGLAGRVLYADKSFASKTEINNCWFDGAIYLHEDGRYAGGIAGYTSYSGVTKEDQDKYSIDYTNCLNTGYIFSDRSKSASTKDPETSFGGQYIGGLLGGTDGTLTLVVKDSLMSGEIDVPYHTYVGSVVSRVNHNGKYNFTNTYATYESYEKERLYNDIAVDGDGNPTGEITTQKEFKLINATDAVNYYAYYSTDLDYKNEWMAQKTDTPILRKFADASQEAVGSADWFKKGSSPYIISSAEELDGLRVLVNNGYNFKGETVKLAKDIALDKNKKWIPIGLSAQIVFDGTFDGDDKEISGINVNVNGYAGLFGYIGTNATLQNFTLKDSTIISSGSNNAAVAGVSKGNLYNIYVKDTVQVSGSSAPTAGIVGIFDNNGNERTISNCWFAGTVANTSTRTGGIVGRIYKGTLTIENCLNTGRLSASSKIGGLIGSVCGDASSNIVATAIVKNSVSKGNVTGSNYAGAVIGSIGEADIKVQNVYAISSKSGYGSVAPESGENNITGLPVVLTEVDLTGNNAYINTLLNLTGSTWQVATNGTPELVAFSDATAMTAFTGHQVTTDWYYNELKNRQVDDEWVMTAGTFKVDSNSDMRGFAKIVNNNVNTFAGQTVELQQSLTFNKSNEPWTKIGINGTSSFRGTFNGGGYTISGVHLDDTTDGTGLFGTVNNNATIRNFVLKDSYIRGGYNLGAIVGNLRGTLDSIYVSSDVTVINGINDANTGGLIGIYMGENHSITKCWFAGTVSSSGNRVAGIVARVYSDNANATLTIKDCLVTGTIESKSTGSTPRVGGLIGANENGKVNIVDCLMTGTVKTAVTAQSGSLIGKAEKPTSISNVYTTDNWVNSNNNKIDSTGIYVANGIGSGSTATNIIGQPIVKSDNQLKGIDGATATQFDFCTTNYSDGAWVATADRPELAQFSTKTPILNLPGNLVSLGWYYSEDLSKDAIEFEIGSAAELLGLAHVVNSEGSYFANDTINMVANIDLNPTWTNGQSLPTGGVQWIPLTNFFGIFNGNNHELRGLYLSGNISKSGFIGELGENAKVMNLVLENSLVDGGWKTGTIVGQSKGDVENVYVGKTVTVKGNRDSGTTGGIVGHAFGTTTNIRRCWFAGTMESSLGRLGAILGRHHAGTTTLEDCLFTGTMVSTRTNSSEGARAGGLVGTSVDANGLIITRCLNNGTLTVSDTKNAGYIVGACTKTVIPTSLYYVEGKLLQASNKAITKTTVTNETGVTITAGSSFDAKQLFAGLFKNADNTPNTNWTVGADGMPVLSWRMQQ